MLVTDKRDSVSLDGVRFEVIEIISHRETGEVKEGWDVVGREWFYHLDDAALWGFVARGVIRFADGERFTVLGMEGDVVSLRGWDGFVVVKRTGETFYICGGYISGRLELNNCVLVGVGCPVWRRSVNYDLDHVRCLSG